MEKFIPRHSVLLFLCVAMLTGLLVSSAGAEPQQAVQTTVNPLEAAAQKLHDQASTLIKSRQWLDAAQLLQQILAEYPEYSGRARVEKKLGDVNIQVIRSDLSIPQTTSYAVQEGETIGSIAQKFATTETLIKVSNGLLSNTIVPGKTLRIWTQPFAIHISKAKNTLTLSTNGETVKIYPVATGADNITPPGEFTITSKLENPTWFKKGEPIPPEDPRNALGSRWLGLNETQYGIHGTIQPDLIGQQVSHGCVRMLNKDVEELYDLVPISAKVSITE